ncbi:MAG: CCA tRNA nucleotidyltransferase, partial [Verrucomicrobiota bacterium]
ESGAAEIVKRLTEEGHEAFFAGGCVRDSLLRKSAKDVDIATSARPDEVKLIYPDAVAVGAHFGVLIIKLGDEAYEVATFRTDGEYIDGRRPESVTFTTAENDALRRDFTVNGLFLNPLTGKVLDFVGGRADLEAGIIRAIGDPDQRFEEDYLRLLRAIRFAVVLEFEIEPATLAAIGRRAPSIVNISAERIRDELARILVHENRVRGFDLLVETGLMKAVLPEILELKGCDQPPQFHPEGDVFVHTRIMLGMLPKESSLVLVLSVLLHDIGKPKTYSFDEAVNRIRFNGHAELGAEMADAILKRLRFPNEIVGPVVEAVANHMGFMNVQKMRTAKLKRFMARDGFEDELELHRVDCSSSNGLLDNYQFLLEKREAFANEPIIPPPLLTGADLIELGWKPGPRFGEVLTAVQTEQLEGRLADSKEALDWIKAQFSDDENG